MDEAPSESLMDARVGEHRGTRRRGSPRGRAAGGTHLGRARAVAWCRPSGRCRVAVRAPESLSTCLPGRVQAWHLSSQQRVACPQLSSFGARTKHGARRARHPLVGVAANGCGERGRQARTSVRACRKRASVEKAGGNPSGWSPSSPPHSDGTSFGRPVSRWTNGQGQHLLRGVRATGRGPHGADI